MAQSRVFFVAAALVLSLAACGGGSSGGGNPLPSGGQTATPSPSPSTSSTQTATLGGAPANFSLGPIAGGVSAQVLMPAVSGSASATLTLTGTLPAGDPAPAARRVHKMRRRDSIGVAVTPIAYIEASLTSSVSISQSPAFTMTVPAGTLSGYAYVVVYDPSNAAAGWNVVAGPSTLNTASTTSLSFPSAAVTPPITLAAGVNYVFAIVQTGSAIPSATPSPTASPVPTTTPGVVEGSGTHLSGSAQYRLQAWTPYGVASGLDFPVQHGWDGTGQNVAIVIDSDVDPSVIQSYLATVGITATPNITTVPVDGATGIPSQQAASGDQDEAYLDVETVAGLAPGAHIYIYDTPGLDDQSIADAYSKINSDGLAHVANSSFGGCEYPNPPEDPFIAAGTAAGITYVASSGDDGNSCDSTTVGASWPASNPNVVAVGGSETAISDHDPITNNTVWNDFNCQGGQCGGGGGVSTIYTLPSYQQGLAGKSSSVYRNEPDISLPAEDDLFSDGQPGIINGTSWASPEYAALMAEVFQYCQLTNGLANAVQVPYFVEAHFQQSYIDVINGNDQFGGLSPYYSAGAGYDNASGFGVPYGMAYANTACPARHEASGLLRYTTTVRAQARTANMPLDVTPRAARLVDKGRRSQIATTRVQVVLNSEGDRSSVERALEQAGFTIDRRFEYNRIVHAQAPAGTVEQFFSTELHDVQQGRYGIRYMPVREVALPASIAGHVQTVNLDDVVTRHVRSHVAPGWPLAALN